MPPEPTDINTWKLALWLNGNWSFVAAGMLCIFITLLRAYMDNVKITMRDVAEAIICGVIVSVSKPVLALAITWFGADAESADGFALFVGAVSGFLGARFLRPFLEALFNRGGKK